jgi:hypothetical protein
MITSFTLKYKLQLDSCFNLQIQPHREYDHLTLKMKAVWSNETAVIIYLSIRHNIPENLNFPHCISVSSVIHSFLFILIIIRNVNNVGKILNCSYRNLWCVSLPVCFKDNPFLWIIIFERIYLCPLELTVHTTALKPGYNDIGLYDTSSIVRCSVVPI